jgi:hypothetical protein
MITAKERLTWEHKDTGTKLFYRRPTSAKQRELQVKNTEAGVIDQGAYLEDLINWSVLGWEGPFVDPDGNPMEFDEDSTRGMPDTYKGQFLLNLYLIDPIQRETGN